MWIRYLLRECYFKSPKLGSFLGAWKTEHVKEKVTSNPKDREVTFCDHASSIQEEKVFALRAHAILDTSP